MRLRLRNPPTRTDGGCKHQLDHHHYHGDEGYGGYGDGDIDGDNDLMLTWHQKPAG